MKLNFKKLTESNFKNCYQIIKDFGWKIITLDNLCFIHKTTASNLTELKKLNYICLKYLSESVVQIGINDNCKFIKLVGSNFLVNKNELTIFSYPNNITIKNLNA